VLRKGWLSSARKRLFDTCRRLCHAPWVYLVVYVALVPVYAVVYCLFSDHFYHPYAKHEPQVREEWFILRERLTTCLRESVRSNPFTLKGASIALQDLTIAHIEPAPHSTTVHLSCNIVREEMRGKGEPPFRFRLALEFAPDGAYPIGAKEGRARYRLLPRLVKDVSFGVPDDVLAQLLGREAKAKTRMAFALIFVDEDTLQRMRSLQAAFRGLPHAVPGGLSRMLYFSAVTITTVGFGDIVPLTTTTRILVASESVIGIVTLGVFVGTLLTRHGRQETGGMK